MIRRSGASAGRQVRTGRLLFLMALATACGLASGLVRADPIKNPIAVFAALDKLTGRI
jgi:hypothetical protein